jgi:hypothetical protein
MATESELMTKRKNILAEIKRRGGKDKAPGFARQLEEVDGQLNQIRTEQKNAPAPEGQAPAPVNGIGNTDPAVNDVDPNTRPTDPSAGGATTGVGTTFSQLLEGLRLGKELYPDGGLGRLENPAPIGPLSPFQKVGMIDQGDIPTIAGINMSEIPQVKELSEAADAGQVQSIGQWEDYYTKSQQKDADIEAAKQRAALAAEKGYDDPTMQAKRAKANREIDNETETALRELRKSQGSAGNFGGVAAAQGANMRKSALLSKAIGETELLAGDADYRLNANAQAGNLATNAYQTYNQAQQAGLTGLSGARNSLADNVLRRQVSNQEAQGKNQSGWLQGKDINLRADTANAGNVLNVKQSNQQAEGVNATNGLTWDKTNKDIEVGNLDRTRDTTTFNMGQNEKEKAGQMGTMFGWTQYGDAQTYQDRLIKLQEELQKMLNTGPK